MRYGGARGEPARWVAAEAALIAALDKCIAAGAPGCILAIEALGLEVSFTAARGLFARGEPRSLRADDQFRAASVTKMATAACAVRLAADRRWDLDDPVLPFLPHDVAGLLGRLDGLPSPDALTIRRLLGHTSGLPDYFFDTRFQARVQADPTRAWRPRELVEAALGDGRLAFPPGTAFSYGDTGYVIVGLAIEHVVEQPLADAYRLLIFAPLEMDATYLEWHEAPRGAGVSHHYDGASDLLAMNTSFDWAGGGLVTTASDLVRFLRGLFGGALFDERWLAELTAWRDQLRWRPDSSARYLRYGLGMGANHACGEEIVGATGVWGAFGYWWPAGGAAIAGTVNLRGVDRSALLDEIVCALKSLR